MGYYARIRETNFHIPADKIRQADEALNKALAKDEKLVENNFWQPVDGVAEALTEIGFDISQDISRGITIYGFDSKWREQEDILDLVKEFVDPDTYIDFIGEDGEMWRWTTDGTKSAVITWV